MKLDDKQISELAKGIVANSIIEFYKDPNNQARYREWYLQKYGTEPSEVIE